MRQAATILIVFATLFVAPSAAADAIFTEQPSLTYAAEAVPGQLTETGAAGPARSAGSGSNREPCVSGRVRRRPVA
jgi:hypothetical protein